jgi:hypothetical protein
MVINNEIFITKKNYKDLIIIAHIARYKQALFTNDNQNDLKPTKKAMFISDEIT